MRSFLQIIRNNLAFLRSKFCYENIKTNYLLSPCPRCGLNYHRKSVLMSCYRYFIIIQLKKMGHQPSQKDCPARDNISVKNIWGRKTRAVGTAYSWQPWYDAISYLKSQLPMVICYIKTEPPRKEIVFGRIQGSFGYTRYWLWWMVYFFWFWIIRRI